MLWRGKQIIKGALVFADKKGGTETILTTSPQWFTEESATKVHTLGTKMVVEDMVFRYAHISAYRASAWRGRGMQNIGKQTSTNCLDDGYRTSTTMTAASSGATSVTVTIDDSYSATADEFKDGVIALFPSTWTGIIQGRIKSNTATSTTTTFYLKEGIQAACGAASTSKINWSPWAYDGTPKTDSPIAFRSSPVGCLNVNATADYYVWLQTWGPYLGQYGMANQPGEGKDYRCVYFDRYGAFINGTDAGVTHQYAGYVLAGTAEDQGDGWTPFVMLQLSP